MLVKNPVSAPGPPTPLKNPGSAPGEPPPECIPCNCPLTIKHLLIKCADVRQRFYQVPSVQDLFKAVKPEVILDFLNQLCCTVFYKELVVA